MPENREKCPLSVSKAQGHVINMHVLSNQKSKTRDMRVDMHVRIRGAENPGK